MKTKLFLSIFFAMMNLSTVFGQNPIPNAGFEDWSGGLPVGWYGNNIPGITPITQSADARSGSSALRAEVLNLGGNPMIPTFWPGSLAEPFVSVSLNYAQLRGYYKLSPVGASDSLGISVIMQNSTAFTIGAGAIILGAADEYTEFVIDIVYSTPGDAATLANIAIGMTGNDQNGGPAIGASVLLDDLEFVGQATDVRANEVQVPKSSDLLQNYPNPFNPETNISFVLASESDVQLQIFNSRGQFVETLVQRRFQPGKHSFVWQAFDQPSGIYYAVLKFEGRQKVMSMTLLK